MTNDETENYLADSVYKVDSKAKGGHIHKGDTITAPDGTNYRVLEKRDNTDNGFQGMAVAPVYGKKVDTSNIQIAYAGTNIGDINDVGADGTDINAVPSLDGNGKTATHGQFKSADNFYERVKKNYGAANIKNIVGHSLGGAEALYIAGKHKKPVTTFSSADPTLHLNKKEMAWLNKHPELVSNYYHKGDPVASWLKNHGLGKSIAVGEFHSDQAGWTKYIGLNGHYLDSYRFDKAGNLITKDGSSIVTKKDISALKDNYKNVIAPKIKSIRSELSSGTVSGEKKSLSKQN